MKKIDLISLFLALLFLTPLSGQTSMEELQDYRSSLVDVADYGFGTLPRKVLAKAAPDECFFGIGDPMNQYVPTGIDPMACENAGGELKTNQAYVWGLCKNGDNLWFGTAPNVNCLVTGSYLGMTGSIETPSFACEFGDSQFSPPFPDALGDWRPSRIYTYNTETEQLEDLTPADPALNQVIGLRSVGSIDNIVFLAGPSLQVNGSLGITLFAFNADTKAYLGSQTLLEYNNIRKWIVVGDVLYTAVGDDEGGHVLRWTGSLGSPFQFEEVGNLTGAGAELAVHEGRLFVTTWPAGLEEGAPTGVASLFMGPELEYGGYTSADANSWTAVWAATDYDPDPVTAATYGGGALASFDGYLFWGTMHVPFLSTAAHFQVYGTPSDDLDFAASLLGTYRAISLFRGRNFATSPNIELAYGQQYLPRYDGSDWDIVPNNMGGQAPLFGPSGFGNPFNNYTWTMAVYGGQLFVGTMDYSYLLFGDLNPTMPFRCAPAYSDDQCDMYKNKYMEFGDIFDPENFLGADLMRFPDGNSPAIPEDLSGVGNHTSYGIRTMISADKLYLGMANPMNLVPPTEQNRGGGWELIELGEAQVSSIPTMTEWGIFLMILLVINLGLLTVFSLNVSVAQSPGTATISRPGLKVPFDYSVFLKKLPQAALLALCGLGIIMIFWGEILSQDIVGLLLTIPLVAYGLHVLHFFGPAKKTDN